MNLTILLSEQLDLKRPKEKEGKFGLLEVRSALSLISFIQSFLHETFAFGDTSINYSGNGTIRISEIEFKTIETRPNREFTASGFNTKTL